MAFEEYTGAFERALAQLVTAFGESPDACFSQADLHAAFFSRLLQSDVLDILYTTRDGRRTPLVHQQYPASPFLAPELGSTEAGSERYDIVLLNPSFVRSSELDAVARQGPPRAARRRADQEPALPLLAAANLMVVDRLSPANMDLIERRFYALVHAERDAMRAYMGVFLRQWELDEEAQQGFQAVESWARQQPNVSICCVQSYRDRSGHIFAGRYLNGWSHKAPLLPMENSIPQQARPAASRKGKAAETAKALEQRP